MQPTNLHYHTMKYFYMQFSSYLQTDVLAWREEEELRLASQKSYKGGTGSLSIIYESESEGSTTDASDSSGEEEHYNRRKKKKGSQTKLSSSSSGSLDPVIIVDHSELLPDTDNNTGSSVSSVRYEICYFPFIVVFLPS